MIDHWILGILYPIFGRRKHRCFSNHGNDAYSCFLERVLWKSNNHFWVFGVSSRSDIATSQAESRKTHHLPAVAVCKDHRCCRRSENLCRLAHIACIVHRGMRHVHGQWYLINTFSILFMLKEGQVVLHHGEHQ